MIGVIRISLYIFKRFGLLQEMSTQKNCLISCFQFNASMGKILEIRDETKWITLLKLSTKKQQSKMTNHRPDKTDIVREYVETVGS